MTWRQWAVVGEWLIAANLTVISVLWLVAAWADRRDKREEGL